MNPCVDFRKALGVYVLGAIEPAERSRLEAHLETCQACREELAAMAGLPALLGRVDVRQLEHVTGPPEDEDFLGTLLTRAAEERAAKPRFRARRLWGPLALAAAFLLVAGFALGGLFLGGGGHHTAQAVPSASRQVSAVDPQTRLQLKIALTPEEWGTFLSVHIKDAPANAWCELRVMDKTGKYDVAASWTIEREGYGDYYGSTGIPLNDISRFEVVRLDMAAHNPIATVKL